MKSNMKTYFTRINSLLFVITIGIYADEIYLKNGQNASTEIIDTAGCSVKIIRRGNNVSIKKNLIDKIIWKNDTISFAGYKCEEKVIPIVRFQDTPEYRIMVLLEKVGELSQVYKENSKVAFLYAPLQGNYNAEEFAGIQSRLIELFNKKGMTTILDPGQMIEAIEKNKNDFDYAFFAKKYHVVKKQVNKNYGPTNTLDVISALNKKTELPAMIGLNSASKKISELTTIADFTLLDVRKKEIVYHKIITEKRSVWGENDYSWVSILTPDAWKKEMEKNQTERKLDRNAKSILNKMEKDISEYLGIKE